MGMRMVICVGLGGMRLLVMVMLVTDVKGVVSGRGNGAMR